MTTVLTSSRRFALVILLVALFAAACGGGDQPDYSTPEKALANLVRAENAGDGKAYAECFVAAEQAELKSTLGAAAITTRAGKVSQVPGFTVGMLLYFRDNKPAGEQPIVFVQEGGLWKANWKETAKYREKHWKPADCASRISPQCLPTSASLRALSATGLPPYTPTTLRSAARSLPLPQHPCA